jgi:putative addiction module component (TIGR02574 family)
MSFVPEVLLEQALTLSPSDRARLASGLLASLDDDQAHGVDVERLWSEETERRMAQFEASQARVVTRDEVRGGLEELRAERSA